MLLLLSRPRYDTGTHYLHAWSELIIEEAKRKNINVIDLDKKKANRGTIQSYLKKRPIDVVIINGHGAASCVCGNDNEVILAAGDGDNLLSGKNVFIRACEAGAILGQTAIQNGCSGFIGYTQSFMFPFDPEFIGMPLKDPLATPILECSNQVALSLMRGHSSKQAHEESMEKYAKVFDELSSSKSAMIHILPFLLWNMDFQVCY